MRDASIDLDALLADVRSLRARIDADVGPADLAHLRKIERWGRCATLVGVLTAGIAPNPLAAIALSIGRSSRWLLMHHCGHRGYDKVPGVPARYTSKVFARGRRRFVDWADWMIPEAWIYEHNILHHQHTGEAKDPDLIERNIAGRGGRGWLLAALLLTWRATYYAPNTLNAWTQRRGPVDAGTRRRLFWRRCMLPNAALQFVAFPLLFAVFGWWGVCSALCNSVLADVLTNAHTFLVVGPNHTADDLYRYDGPPASRGDYYRRQILGSANYRTGGDLCDWAHLWLNYQIEHHLFPDVPMLQYRKIQPAVRELCARHGIPYVQESVFTRFRKMAAVFLGRTRMRRLDAAAVPDTVGGAALDAVPEGVPA